MGANFPTAIMAQDLIPSTPDKCQSGHRQGKNEGSLTTSQTSEDQTQPNLIASLASSKELKRKRMKILTFSLRARDHTCINHSSIQRYYAGYMPPNF